MQRVLLIPARFTDCRMWGGIPDQLARRASVSHLDQLISLPWAAAPDAVVGPARSQMPDGWDVVVAGDHAAEVRAELLDFERAEVTERYLPEEAGWLWRRERLLDRLLDRLSQG